MKNSFKKLKLGKCGENVKYFFDETTGKLVISGTGDMQDYVLNHDSPFNNNCSIKTIDIENGVTSISRNAFDGCVGLTDITIPNSVKRIGDSAFNGCMNLKSITIPKSVVELGLVFSDEAIYAFQGCTGLTKIEVDSDNPNFCCDERGALFTKNKEILLFYPIGSEEKSYIIPNTVTIIARSAFKENTVLTNVVIPEGVKYIGAGAFRNCTQLTDIVIPDSVSFIGAYSFGDCKGLKKVSIPCSADYAYYLPFKRPNSCISASFHGCISDSFHGCDNIEKVIITKGNGTMSNFNKEKDEYIIRYFGNNIGFSFRGTPWCNSNFDNLEVVIEDGVKNIGIGAFFNCKALKKITIPSSVKTIGEKAFFGCDNLSLIYFKGSKKQWDDINGNYKCVNWAEIMDNNSRSNQMKAEMHYSSVGDMNNLKDIEIIYEN